MTNAFQKRQCPIALVSCMVNQIIHCNNKILILQPYKLQEANHNVSQPLHSLNPNSSFAQQTSIMQRCDEIPYSKTPKHQNSSATKVKKNEYYSYGGDTG